MQMNEETQKILNSLKHGNGQGAIDALDAPKGSIDYDELRTQILEESGKLDRSAPEKTFGLKEDVTIWGDENKLTRHYMMQALARVGVDDSVLRYLEESLRAKGPWTRYAALLALKRYSLPDAKKQADKIITEEPPSLVYQLAYVILAEAKIPAAINKVREALQNSNKDILDPTGYYNIQWITAYALADVNVAGVEDLLIDIVANQKPYSDTTWQAICALALYGGSADVQDVAQALEDFIRSTRNAGSWAEYRTQAINSLGQLKIDKSALLIDEITNDNLEIVNASSKAMECMLGTVVATDHVVEKASKDKTNIKQYAEALRRMGDQNAIADELSSLSTSSRVEEQKQIALDLLTEIGGHVAFQKLQARTKATQDYVSAIGKLEGDLQQQLADTLKEAHNGYVQTSIMDWSVFVAGLLLIIGSATIILVKGGTLDTWAGAGVSGTAGLLGVIYKTLISPPRKQADEETNHLMSLKTVFLGYIRQLNQTDLLFVRHIQEDDKAMNATELGEYSKRITEVMDNAMSQIKETTQQQKKTKNKTQEKTT